MQYKHIKFEMIDAVAKIIFDRADVLNSFNRDMSFEFQEALDYCRRTNEIRCILITGNGRAFCAGQDLAEASQPGVDLGDIVKNCFNPIIRKIRNIEKPVVASINGIAAGAGANIALACDIVIASREASFVQAFSKIGLIPDSGGTFFLPRLVGLARATALAFFGQKITADYAVEIGLIYQSVEPDHLEIESMKLAKMLADMPTRGLGLTKKAFNNSYYNNLDGQLDFEEILQSEAGTTFDYHEGISAFLEKRKPNFKGE